ncbi:hypothetical protein A6D98_09970 [Aliivibrio fischeri]|uniref:hypothetical protein n=1 Tax=Aliivibrio fischeri TaxID=668 RepID=UPI00080DEBA7|nr:hypothetical protein [Aliivibrio fischeri]OCH60917.1 hypothetical protein A6D98_09970 [Aliivibrio fischeri]
MTPPPQKQYNFNTRLLEAYRDAVFNLAEEFGLMCINGVEVFKNVDSTYFSDNVHFKDVGYKHLASKITSRILSNLKTPTSVFSGTNIVTRFNDDGIKFRFNQWGINLSKSGQNTPPLNSYSGGYVTETSQYNEYLYFSFYSEVDDLVITPNINVTNAKLTVDLDHGLPQPQYTFDDRVWRDTSPDRDAKPGSSIGIDALDKSIWLDRLSDFDVLSSCRIHVATKGWHTVRVWIEENGSAGDPILTVAGINFIDYETAKLIDDYRYKRSGNHNPIGRVKPLFVGEEFLDASQGEHRWYKSTGLNTNDWKNMTSTPEDSVHSGNESPVNNVTPRYLGDEYLDTSPGQYIWYKATGTASNSWKPIN